MDQPYSPLKTGDAGPPRSRITVLAFAIREIGVREALTTDALTSADGVSHMPHEGGGWRIPGRKLGGAVQIGGVEVGSSPRSPSVARFRASERGFVRAGAARTFRGWRGLRLRARWGVAVGGGGVRAR